MISKGGTTCHFSTHVFSNVCHLSSFNTNLTLPKPALVPEGGKCAGEHAWGYLGAGWASAQTHVVPALPDLCQDSMSLCQPGQADAEGGRRWQEGRMVVVWGLEDGLEVDWAWDRAETDLGVIGQIITFGSTGITQTAWVSWVQIWVTL